MSATNDGGPAFPTAHQAVHAYAAAASIGIEDATERERAYVVARGEAVRGMSLRDYFAAKAMQAQMITDTVPGEACDALLQAAAEAGQDPIDRLCINSYHVADAMLKARGS